MTLEEKRDLEIMLKRIAGQVGGISKMINDGGNEFDEKCGSDRAFRCDRKLHEGGG